MAGARILETLEGVAYPAQRGLGEPGTDVARANRGHEGAVQPAAVDVVAERVKKRTLAVLLPDLQRVLAVLVVPPGPLGVRADVGVVNGPGLRCEDERRACTLQADPELAILVQPEGRVEAALFEIERPREGHVLGDERSRRRRLLAALESRVQEKKVVLAHRREERLLHEGLLGHDLADDHHVARSLLRCREVLFDELGANLHVVVDDDHLLGRGAEDAVVARHRLSGIRLDLILQRQRPTSRPPVEDLLGVVLAAVDDDDDFPEIAGDCLLLQRTEQVLEGARPVVRREDDGDTRGRLA